MLTMSVSNSIKETNKRLHNTKTEMYIETSTQNIENLHVDSVIYACEHNGNTIDASASYFQGLPKHSATSSETPRVVLKIL